MENKNNSHKGEHITVINESLSDHPKCIHGPNLKFKKTFDSGAEPIEFYACSAFRNHECSVLTNNYKKQINVRPAHLQKAPSKSTAFGLAEITKPFPKKRAYCHTCACLFTTNEKNLHQNHDSVIGISDEMLRQPTHFLKPLANDSREAQYFFANSTLKCFVNIFKHLGFSKIICIGAPRLHEYLKLNFSSFHIKSIILDLDSRLKLFFDTNEYFEYNMMNDYFFDGPDKRILFEKFLKETKESKTCVVTDPPFACRTEPLSFTIKTISERYRKINSIFHILPIMWIFPYFMENYIKNVMPEMDMMDYMVNYTNHKLYHGGLNGRKEGSPIRIFTNIPLYLVPLPESEDYRYCKLCGKYTFKENEHCKKCGKCPSKNGSKYVHCELCAICVKPNYRHCVQCSRCTQVGNHDCKTYQRNITCWICLIKGHNEVNCERWTKFKKQALRIKKKSMKLRKKICLICSKIGHNEQNCKKRNILLRETKFLGEIVNMFSK